MIFMFKGGIVWFGLAFRSLLSLNNHSPCLGDGRELLEVSFGEAAGDI